MSVSMFLQFCLNFKSLTSQRRNNPPVGIIWSRSFRVIHGLWGSCSGCTEQRAKPEEEDVTNVLLFSTRVKILQKTVLLW